MNNDTRKSLISKRASGTPFLRLTREGLQSAESFEIVRELDRGGSCICYEARMLAENKIGRLKEFYPRNHELSLERRNRVLLPKTAARDRFCQARNEFIHIHHWVNEKKAKKCVLLISKPSNI